MSLSEVLNIRCPYCGEGIDVLIDCTVNNQNYIEDCQVCCKPITLKVELDEEDQRILEGIRLKKRFHLKSGPI